MLGNRHLERARLLLSTGRAREAEREASQALNDNPSDEEALLLIAECKMELREFDGAILLLNQCIGIDPENDRVFYLLAFCHYHQNEHNKALALLDQAIAIYPWNSGYFGLYAYILIEDRRFKEALEKANEGLSLDPEDLTCLNARSKAQFRMNNKEGAYQTIKEALKVEPDNDFTHSNYGWYYLEAGKQTKAREHFREALRINPGSNHAREGLKESMKANLAPYRYILMFSLWMASKSKSARWGIVIVIWLAIKILSGASESAGLQTLSIVIISCYFLFVILSWIGNSLANLYLSFHKEGKYALSTDERQNAYAVGAALTLALILMPLSLLPGADERFLISGIVCFSLSIPLSQLVFPINWKNTGLKHCFSILLLITGLCVIFVLSANVAIPAFQLLFPAYAIGLLLYMWTAPMMKK